MGTSVIGILGLQGAFAKHIEMIKNLGKEVCDVRRPKELETCDGLIIPGGESTTIMRQMNFIGMNEALNQFGKSKPIFGTCAGLILMSQEIKDDAMKPFGFLDIVTERNAFGRQVDSFQAEVEVQFERRFHFPAIFIRAPRIRSIGENVKVLATHDGEPILVRQGHHLAATFHPELTENPAIHQYFLKIIEGKGK